MKPTRVAAILMLAFLFGGSSAEVAVQTKRAIDRHRAAQEEGSAGELVSFEIQREDGEVLARPRVIAAPGKPTELVLRSAEDPEHVRLSLRVETSRLADGDVNVSYELQLPSESLVCRGQVSVTPGVEHTVAVGEQPVITATLLAIPVPSAAFDAYLDADRRARRLADPT